MKEYLTVKEIAESLGVSKPTVQKVIHDLNIEPSKIERGKYRMYSQEAIEKIIAVLQKQPPNNRQETAKQPPNNRQETAKEPPNNRQITAKQPPRNRQETAEEPPNNRQGTAKEPPRDRQETAKEPPRNRQETAKEPPRNRQETAEEPPNNRQGTAKQPPNNRQTTAEEPPNNEAIEVLKSALASIQKELEETREAGRKEKENLLLQLAEKDKQINNLTEIMKGLTEGLKSAQGLAAGDKQLLLNMTVKEKKESEIILEPENGKEEPAADPEENAADPEVNAADPEVNAADQPVKKGFMSFFRGLFR